MKKSKHCTNLKRLSAICIIAIAALCFVAVCSCERIVLERITVVYSGGDILVGGSPNKADIAVTAHYSDGTSKSTNKFAVLYDFAEIGEKTVTVIYTEGKISVEASFDVKVVARLPEAVVTLTSVSAEYNNPNIESNASGGDSPLNAMVNGQLNDSYLTVTAHYSDGTSRVVTGYNVGSVDPSVAGLQQITVSFTDNGVTKECSLEIFNLILPPVPTLTALEAVYDGANVTLGGQLNDSYLTVTAYYSDGTSSVVTNYSVGNYSSAVAGAQQITISFTDNGVTKECSLEMLVTDPDAQVVADGSLSIHFLELGNANTGDCVYIKAGDTDILIDAGSRKNSAKTLIKYINQFVKDGKLEYVIVTHEHQDHISGFMGESKSNGIFQEYECGTIIDFPRYNAKLTTATGKDSLMGEYIKARDAEVEAGAKHYTALECVNNANGAQKVYNLTEDGSIKLEILYQRFYENYTSDENDYSVCAMITQGENNYLFTGDLEHDGEESLVESNPDLPQMVLFKGGHHGSYTATGEVLLRKIKPQYICICCCAGNVEYTQNLSRSFPAQEMIDRIAPYTDKVYVTTLGPIKYDEEKQKYVNDGFTSMNGNIVFSCTDGVISLECSNNNDKLKDTEWFKKYRICPDAWKQDE